MSTDKSALERVLSLAVFAPLGVAQAVREAVPEWVEQGRARAVEQYTAAKAVGELATDYGHKVVADTLVGLGILPGPPPPPPSPAPIASQRPPPAASNGGPEPGPTPAVADGPVLASDELAIPGYDSLSASQVVSRLAGLAPAELESVRAYEAASRGRRTILTRVSQLQAGRA